MKWQCFLFPADFNASGVSELVGGGVATKKLVVGSDGYREAVDVISRAGGGDIRLKPAFSKKAIDSFELYRIYPSKLVTVSDRMYELNLDYVNSLEPYRSNLYGEHKHRIEFFGNKPKVKADQFSALDFSDHIYAPVSFLLDDIENYSLRSAKQEVWPEHHILNTKRVAEDFCIDESVEIVNTDRGFKRPNFKGLMTLTSADFQSLGSLFKIPGPSDVGDSFWGCSKRFYELYNQSEYSGLKFEPILIHNTKSYNEYRSEWLEILNDLNEKASWESVV